MTTRSNPIGLASGVLIGCPAEVTVTAAASAGFDRVGLWVVPDEWPTTRRAAVRRLMVENGVAPLDIEVLRLAGSAPNYEAKRMVEIAAELGAPNLLVVGTEPDLPAFIDCYAALCELGVAHNLRIALEFMLFSSVQTLAAARTIIEAVNSPAAALLIDPLHLDRAGNTPEDVGTLLQAWLPYAQFCDAPLAHIAPTDYPALLEEAREDRLLPGTGALPLAPLLRALPPGTPLSIELRSRWLRDTHPDPVDRAIAVRTATDLFLAPAAAA